jgi:predicted methyltransferase
MLASLLGGIAGDVEVYGFERRDNYTVAGWLLLWLLRECKEKNWAEARQVNGLQARCSGGRLLLSTGKTEVEVEEAGVRGPFWYRVSPEGLRPLEIRGAGGYYRLHSPRPGIAPTLLINGIVMHRVAEGWDPLLDARAKVALARPRRGSLVLDTCMGLGYTASEAAARGARVVTVEVSRAVLALAEHNPYSSGLASGRVTVLVGDIAQVVEEFREGAFDRVIHDPPRFSVAGDLYSLEFYRKLYRVLRPGGVLVHYTGMPQRGRGRGHGPIVRGVMERLRAAGFRVLGFREKALSVVAVKPR